MLATKGGGGEQALENDRNRLFLTSVLTEKSDRQAGAWNRE